MVQILLGPIVGCIIGYLTNSLAIRMLFRPHRAVYLGKWRLPFTPGLIPKEKSRIADSIGGVVSGELLNDEVFLSTLTSERVLNQIGGWLDDCFGRALKSRATLREKLNQVTDSAAVDEIIREINLRLSALVKDKLEKFHFGEEIARQSLEALREKYRNEISIKSVLSRFLDDHMIEILSETLGEKINLLVVENSGQIADGLLDHQVEDFFNKEIGELTQQYADKQELLRSALLKAYCRLICRDLQRILETLDLSSMVRERIDSYDTVQLEEILRKIMKKELRAIIWLGALLGFFMGFLNSGIYFLS